jgi:type II secretory pathway pseudopilin PulG
MKPISKIRRDSRQGYTLIELLVVSLISIIVIYAAIDFFNNQQKVFRQQASQARNQANLRLGLYYIAHDLMNAGYTGGPFGVEGEMYRAEATGSSSPVAAVKPVNFSTDPQFSTLKLTNQAGQTIDGIEMWFNINTQPTSLSAISYVGTNTLAANTVTMFQVTAPKCDMILDSCTPFTGFAAGFIISKADGSGEYEPISSVDLSGKTITAASALTDTYVVQSVVAPVWRRVYYLRDINGTRWLVRRDYFANNQFTDTKLAEGVADLQVTYDMIFRPSLGDPPQLTPEVDPDKPPAYLTPFNPKYIDSVNVSLVSAVHDIQSKKPLQTVMTRKVKIMNLGLHPKLRGY